MHAFVHAGICARMHPYMHEYMHGDMTRIHAQMLARVRGLIHAALE